jgi:hypothetical protein
MPSAAYSLYGSRLFAVATIALSCTIIAQVAQHLRLNYWWLLPLFIYGQPWSSEFAYATTVVPLTFLLCLGVYSFLRHAHYSVAVCAGLLPLIRHETIILLLIWLAYYLIHRRLFVLLVAVLPLALYNLGSYIAIGTAPFFIFLTPEPTKIYGSGGWLHFLPSLWAGIGAVPALYAILSVFAAPKLRAWLATIWPFAVYLLSHVFLYRFGLYASGGYSYFLLPIACAVGLLALAGFEWMGTQRLSEKLRRTLTAALIGILLWQTLGSRPLPIDPEALASKQASDWVYANYPSDTPIIATHVWFYYFHNLPLAGANRLWWDTPDPRTVKSSSLFVWDSHYSNSWGWQQTYLDDPANRWHSVKRFQNMIVIYQRD